MTRPGLVVIVVSALLVAAAWHLYTFKSKEVQSLVSPIFSGQNQRSITLEQSVQTALEGTKGRYGVVIKNLKTDETYSFNQDQEFEPGSLYKLWVMVEVFRQIESEDLKEDQVLSQSIPTLNAKFGISPDAAEQTEGRVSFRVSEALNQMITISHNYAALILSEKVRLSSVARFLEQSGFEDSKVGIDGSDPVTTPSEMALFYQKLYQGELANPENTIKMLELLKRQQLNHKIPKYLPAETVVAHKTGELGWFSHDAGIVYTPQGDYIIVVLSESESPKGAEDRIAEVSKAVYEYFTNP